MRLRWKLTSIVALVAVVPLFFSGVLTLHIHQRAFDDQVRALHASAAEQGADKTRALLDGARQGVELLVHGSIRWGTLSPDERSGALNLVYRQHPDVAIATLLDGRGAGVGNGLFRSQDSAVADVTGHPVVTLDNVSAFAAHIPFAIAHGGKTTWGEPFFGGERAALVPLGVPTPGVAGETWVVALAVSLRSVCEGLRTRGGIERLLVGPDRRLLCGGGQPLVDDPSYLTASSALPNGWSVVTRQPRAEAFAASHALRLQNLAMLATALAVAIGAGLLLAGGLVRRVRRLVGGARTLASGNFSARIELDGGDELGDLGAAFNAMTDEIKRRDDEIRSFNVELQARVDERTRELKETQTQLLQSQKIAAVSSLGAGIAHEINNPLTSVLGFAQVLRRRMTAEKRDKDAQLLDTIDAEGQRIRKIVQTLLTFSQGFAGEGFTELDPNVVLESALQQVPLGRVELVRELAHPLPRVLGNSSQLQEAMIQLLKNALTAMKGKGRLTLRTQPIEGLVKLEVIDTGKGIAPENLGKIFDPFFTTKDDWHGEGLGLTLVHRIVEQHHGRIKASSRVGEGSTFTLTLPVASRRAHLA